MHLIVFRPSSWPSCGARHGSACSPVRVLGGELDDQALQRSGHAGPSAVPLGSDVVLLGDELAVPAQDRIGGHQAAELVQGAAAERTARRRQPAALVVCESQATVTELLAKDAVLLLEVLDDLALGRFTQPANTSSRN